VREKYGWLVADKPSEQADYFAGLLLLAMAERDTLSRSR
jgi:hypothetical protein